MHTTNNVPQSRCRVFLIYGELSEMGRWSKRRWRHAEGLHFSLFSPHKQEKPVSVCHNTQTHSHTWLKDTSACMHKHRRVPPPPFTRSLRHRRHHFHHTQTHELAHTYPPLLRHNPTLPCNPQQNTHGHIPLPRKHTHTQAYTTKNYPTTIGPSQTHTGKSSGFGWTRLRTLSNEPPHALYRVCRK